MKRRTGATAHVLPDETAMKRSLMTTRRGSTALVLMVIVLLAAAGVDPLSRVHRTGGRGRRNRGSRWGTRR